MVLLLVGAVTIGAVLAGAGDRSLLPGAALLTVAAGVIILMLALPLIGALRNPPK